ncbi:MAG: multidrug transporter [Paenibacillaceae bacterium]|jgi:EmrB/QacA subfamily drug resistance transporter|nr:multidrug transporter [Paenibacillaceae bacterium]
MADMAISNQSGNANRWKILQIVNIGTFMATLDVGIVNVSLPVMAAQFGVSLAGMQWAVTAYLLAMIALLPIAGKLSDRWERRTIYSAGFFVFAAGSLWIAVSGGFAGLIAGRCLQGVGATMIMANSQAIVRQVFPDNERGKALGINAIVISAGTLAGPALGGLLLSVVDWPWLFLLNVPLGLAACLLGLRLFPRDSGTGRSQPLDIPGAALLAAAMILLMLSAERLKQAGFDTGSLTFGAIGLALLVIFAAWEWAIKHGIIDRELFSRRNVLIGNLSGFCINLAQTATIVPIAFYMEAELNYSATLTGILLMLQPLLLGMVAPFAGRFRDRYSAKVPVATGSLACGLSMLCVALPPHVTIVGIAFQLALFGLGTGMFFAANNAEIMSAAPAAKISLAGSMLALIRYLGMIAGIGLATLLTGTMGASHAGEAASPMLPIDGPMRLLFAICSLVCLSATALTFLRAKRSHAVPFASDAPSVPNAPSAPR